MKEIQLTQGKIALVDDEDFERINQWKWCAIRIRDDYYYAVRRIAIGKRSENKGKTIIMHRVIMGTVPGIEIDHKNRNGLDNRKENLREATRAQNTINTRTRITTWSGLRGVDWYPKYNQWRARITIDKKTIHLGYFDTKEEAHQVYTARAVEAFGEFYAGRVI